MKDDCSETSSTKVANHIAQYFRDSTSTVDSPLPQTQPQKEDDQNLVCRLCLNRSGRADNYIILSCDHIFHVNCLTESQFTDIMDYPIIDSNYFSSRKCHCCSHPLQSEELFLLHRKFFVSTKDRLSAHQFSIASLEERLAKLKDELKTCYEYKHKLERDREKSKDVIATLMTMM